LLVVFGRKDLLLARRAAEGSIPLHSHCLLPCSRAARGAAALVRAKRGRAPMRGARRAQDRMHLDCVFSILGDDVCLMLEEMMGEDSPTRRLVDEYSRPEPGKPYALSRQGVEFADYMRDNGYHIIPVVGADPQARAPPPPPRPLRVPAGASGCLRVV